MSTKLLKILPRNIPKKRWLGKVLLLLNFVLGQSILLHSIEFSKKLDPYKLQEIKPTNN